MISVIKLMHNSAKREKIRDIIRKKMGDNSHVALWLVLALLLALSIAVFGLAAHNTKREHGR